MKKGRRKIIRTNQSVDSLLGPGEAASTLGVHMIKLQRWARSGYIQPITKGNLRLYPVEELKRIKNQKKQYSRLEENIKEIYACKKTLIPDVDIMHAFDIDYQKDLGAAIEEYIWVRRRHISKTGVRESSQHLFTSEVEARLKIKYREIIPALVEQRKLVRPAGSKGLITIRSLIDYMGEYSQHVLYRVSEDGRFNWTTSQWVRDNARKLNLGFRVGTGSMSGFRYTSNELHTLNFYMKRNRLRVDDRSIEV